MTPMLQRLTPIARLVATLALASGLGACVVNPRDVDVMSFNIRYGTANDGENAWPLRRDLVFEVIRHHDPDLLGLQEALGFQLDELAEAFGEYDRIGVGRVDGVSAGEHAAILFRRERFLLIDEGTFWFSDTPEDPGSMSWGNTITRIATWARLMDRRTETTFLLYNVHLDHRSQPSRERSTQLLMQRMTAMARPGEPVILTGDFNAGEDTQAIATIREEPPRLLDTFRVVHPDADRVGTFNGFEGRTEGAKIDYVFVTRDVIVVEAAVVRDEDGGRYPSDHFPVSARVNIVGPE